MKITTDELPQVIINIINNAKDIILEKRKRFMDRIKSREVR